MTVNVTKPAINLREKLSELDKPAGIAGTEILRADTPQEVFNYINAGRRNLIINGAMQVAQRGTSQSSIGYGSLDRWYLNAVNGVTVTQTATTAQESALLGGMEYYARLVGTNTDSNRQWFQKIEGLKQFANQTITVSFFAKASASTTVGIQYGLLGAGNDTYQVFDTKEISTSWAKYSSTVTLPSMTSGFTFASGDNLRITLNLQESSYTLDITGFQLEFGSVATPFEHRSYGEELALCQRYFFASDNSELNAVMGNSTEGNGMGNFPVYMRAAPTAYDTSGGSISNVALDRFNTGSNLGNFSSLSCTRNGIQYFTIGSSTGSQGLPCRPNATWFDAEL
jgi:hypothetical protein